MTGIPSSRAPKTICATAPSLKSRRHVLPRNKFFNAVFVTVLFLVLPARAGAQWATLEKGFSYRDSDQARVHFLRIDPSRFRVDLLLGTDYGTPTLTAHQYRERSG